MSKLFKIQIKNKKSDKVIGFLAVALIVIIVIICVLITKFYVGSAGQLQFSDNTYDTDVSSANSNYRIVGSDGLYGVIDRNGNEIVPCIWEELKFLDDDVFIAAKLSEDSFAYGIINSQQEIISPFVYSGISEVVENVLACTLYDSGKYIFTDNLGNVLIDGCWDDFEYSVDENVLILKDGSNFCTALIEEDYLNVVSMVINKKLSDKRIAVNIVDSANIPQSDYKNYTKLVNTVFTYMTALFEGDGDTVLMLAGDELYPSVNFTDFRNASIIEISEAGSCIYSDSAGNVRYTATINIRYAVTEPYEEISDSAVIKSTAVSIELKHSSDGSFKLSSVRKT